MADFCSAPLAGFYTPVDTQPLNPMKVEAALGHWSSPCAPHRAETRLCISLPFSISFIANIARKRPELNRDKTNGNERGGQNRDEIAERMTREAIEEAQAMARECMSRDYQHCGQ